MAATRQLCTFYLGGQCFGIEVLGVQEVIRFQEMTHVPLAHPVVRGLINLRGQIVTALDLRRRLEMPAAPEGHQPVNVVVQTDDGAVSLLVDEIGDVLEVSEADFERPPETLQGAARELVRGAYKLPDRLLLVLDTARATSLPQGGRDGGYPSSPGQARSNGPAHTDHQTQGQDTNRTGGDHS
jgi:purine-binding chemotaxis protein CheW